MSELTITAAGFILQPLVDLPNGPAEIRWWYNRPFLTSEGTQVGWGTGRTGFWVTTTCAIAAGLITVDEDTTLWTTDNAQDPQPASILVSAAVYSVRGKLIQQLQIAGNAQWVEPSSQSPTTTWQAFSTYNQAVYLANPNPSFYTAAEVERRLDQSIDEHPASDLALGTVLLTVPADQPAQPVVWGANDSLVRDAIKIQGVDVDNTAPLDTQVLIFNETNNQYEPGNQASGSGNVISNEISSVDGQVALASGTGGKTIKFSTITDDGTEFNATGMRVIATEYDSDSANLADNGTVRFNKDDFIAWRNELNSGNVILDKDASDRIASSGGFAGTLTGNVTGTATNVADGDKGDVTVLGGAWTIDNDAVTDAKLRDSAALTVIGRSANSTGNPADIAAVAASGSVLRESGSTVGFGTVATAGIADDAVTYAKMQNVSAADKLLGRGNGGGAGDVQEVTLGTNLSMSGTTLNASSGTGTVGNVGTLTDNAVIVGAGGTDIEALASLGTTTTVLHGNAAGLPTFGAVALATDVSGDLPLANLAQASAASKLLGRGDSGAGDYQEITLGTNLSMSGTTLNAAGSSGGLDITTIWAFTY